MTQTSSMKPVLSPSAKADEQSPDVRNTSGAMSTPEHPTDWLRYPQGAGPVVPRMNPTAGWPLPSLRPKLTAAAGEIRNRSAAEAETVMTIGLRMGFLP